MGKLKDILIENEDLKVENGQLRERLWSIEYVDTGDNWDYYHCPFCGNARWRKNHEEDCWFNG